MRLGLLPLKLRKRVDKLFRRMLREDGMPWFRAWYYYQAVRMFGEESARPGASQSCPANDVR